MIYLAGPARMSEHDTIADTGIGCFLGFCCQIMSTCAGDKWSRLTCMSLRTTWSTTPKVIRSTTMSTSAWLICLSIVGSQSTRSWLRVWRLCGMSRHLSTGLLTYEAFHWVERTWYKEKLLKTTIPKDKLHYCVIEEGDAHRTEWCSKERGEIG